MEENEALPKIYLGAYLYLETWNLKASSSIKALLPIFLNDFLKHSRMCEFQFLVLQHWTDCLPFFVLCTSFGVNNFVALNLTQSGQTKCQ